MGIGPDKDEGVLVDMLQWFEVDGPDVGVEPRGAAVRRQEPGRGAVAEGRDEGKELLGGTAEGGAAGTDGEDAGVWIGVGLTGK